MKAEAQKRFHEGRAAALRADALTLRVMVEALELRAGDEEALARQAAIELELAAAVRSAPLSCLRSAGRRRPHEDDGHDFAGVCFRGTAEEPVMEFN
ncbi:MULTISPECIES: hypothetical protein [Methylobacterium]|uniref:hypothetical protein n=1 Tax=Methylobacterium TaxID=407 RepID=UPI001EE20C44|nr:MULTISPECIES: hypothetical protein [Methylobacterium]